MEPRFPQVAVLSPPYRALVAVPERPPLGAILVADSAAGSSALTGAFQLQRLISWCPLCVLVTPSLGRDPATVEVLVRAQIESPAVCSGSVSTVAPADILHAIDHRDLPRPADLASFASSRLENRRIALWLETAIASGSAADGLQRALHMSADTLQRRLRAVGGLRPRDWHGLAQLVRALAYARIHPWLSLARVAADCGTSERTLRARVVRLAGTGLHDAAHVAGWEWLVEAMLRRWGYVEEPEIQAKQGP